MPPLTDDTLYLCSTPVDTFLVPDLFLPQDDDSSRLDGMPGCQVVTTPQLLPILVCLPLAIPCRPGDADVVPLPITYLQRQLGNLQGKGKAKNIHFMSLCS